MAQLINEKLLGHYIKIYDDREDADDVIIDGQSFTPEEACSKLKFMTDQERAKFVVIVEEDGGGICKILHYEWSESTDVYRYVWSNINENSEYTSFWLYANEEQGGPYLGYYRQKAMHPDKVHIISANWESTASSGVIFDGVVTTITNAYIKLLNMTYNELVNTSVILTITTGSDYYENLSFLRFVHYQDFQGLGAGRAYVFSRADFNENLWRQVIIFKRDSDGYCTIGRRADNIIPVD